jgi:hypothetical protein
LDLTIKQCLGSHGCPVTRAGRFASRIAALAFAERHYGCFRFVFSVISPSTTIDTP